MTSKHTKPKITVTRAPLSDLKIEWDHDPTGPDFHMYPPRVRCQCPDCLKLWWRRFHPGGVVHHRGRPRVICPACQAARDFAALPWWRKVLARIGGRR